MLEPSRVEEDTVAREAHVVVQESEGQQMTAEELSELPIYKHDIPPDTIKGWEERNDRGWMNYGRFFKSRDECDLFTMLPLNDEQRKSLLCTMLKEKEATKLQHHPPSIMHPTPKLSD